MLELVINLPETDKPILQRLEDMARQRHITIDNLLRQLIISYVQPKPLLYNDLTFLAGTWTDEQTAEFEQATVEFTQIDEGLWQ